jgi:hypothetical protein
MASADVKVNIVVSNRLTELMPTWYELLEELMTDVEQHSDAEAGEERNEPKDR